MGALQNEWRTRAAELEKELPALLESKEVNKTQVIAQHALLMRELLPSLADMLDVVEASNRTERLAAQLGRLTARNNRVRLAAIKGIDTGNWDEFSNIIDEQLAGAANGSQPEAGSSASAPVAAGN